VGFRSDPKPQETLQDSVLYLLRSARAGTAVGGQLAAHPLQAGPVCVEELIPRKTADVVEAPVSAPVPDQWGAGALADAPGGLPAPGAMLAGPEARPVAAGALLVLVPEALN